MYIKSAEENASHVVRLSSFLAYTSFQERLIGAYPTCKIPFPPASHLGGQKCRSLGLDCLSIRSRLTQFVLECPLPVITLELVVTGMGSVPSVGNVNSTHVLT